MKYPVLAALAVAVASLHAADEAKPAATAIPTPPPAKIVKPLTGLLVGHLQLVISQYLILQLLFQVCDHSVVLVDMFRNIPVLALKCLLP